MRRSAENIIGLYDRKLEPAGITVHQYTLLKNIGEHEGCSIRMLADLADLDRSTVARSLRPLMKAGLLEDTKEAGARDSKLCLTDSGKAANTLAASLWEQAQKEFEDLIGMDQVNSLETILLAMQEL